jgi:hypothetical protein
MPAETLLTSLLVAQGAMGGVDTLLNHELIERLPRRLEARREIGLHSMREALYAALFLGLGWFQWHGTAALAIAVLFVVEIGVDAIDEWTENRTRVLPQNERVLHMFLILNLGAIAVALALVLPDWHAQATALVFHHRGGISWLLLALGASAAGWSVRDFLAWRRLGYRPPPLTNSSDARKTSRSFS